MNRSNQKRQEVRRRHAENERKRLAKAVKQRKIIERGKHETSN